MFSSSPSGLRILSQIQLERAALRIAIGANGEAQRLLGLSECVPGLDHPDLARGNFRLGAIDIERRQGPQFERALVAVITCLGQLQRLLLHVEGAPGLHRIPILADHLQDGVVDLGFKTGARLLTASGAQS